MFGFDGFNEMNSINKLTALQKVGLVELVLAMLLMGTVGYFVIESGEPAHNVVFYRCVIGVVFLVIYSVLKGYFKNIGLTTRGFVLVLLSGVFLVCNWVMLFTSFKYASISTSTAVYHVQPFFFVLISAMVLKETLQVDKVIWMIPAFLGVTLVANISWESFSLSSETIKGLLLAVSAAFFWATSAVLVKFLKGVRPHLITLFQLGVGAIVLLPFANLDDIISVTNTQWVYLLILGAIHTCLVYILMYSSYQKLETYVVAVLTFIYPVVAIVVDYIFYSVSLSLLQLIGVGLIIFSGYAVNQNIQLIRRSVKLVGE